MRRVTRLITDDHVAALRAMLSEDADEAERLGDRVARSDEPLVFNAIIAAAFTLAVHRRFGGGYTVADIIHFVAHERTRFDDSADDFDPRVAERLTLAALGDGSIEGVEDEAKANAQIALLMGLVDDEDFDDAGLDEFLDEARKVAEAAAPQLEKLLRERQ